MDGQSKRKLRTWLQKSLQNHPENENGLVAYVEAIVGDAEGPVRFVSCVFYVAIVWYCAVIRLLFTPTLRLMFGVKACETKTTVFISLFPYLYCSQVILTAPMMRVQPRTRVFRFRDSTI